MSGVSLQFHALPEEIPDLLANLLEDKMLVAKKVMNSPFRCEGIGEIQDVVEDGEVIGIVFSLDKIVEGAGDLEGLARLNPDVLILRIGRISDAELAESWISSVADDRVALSRWRRAVKAMQTMLSSGAIAQNPNTGAVGPMKWHRYSKGAKGAYAKGIKIRPVAGNSIIKLL